VLGLTITGASEALSVSRNTLSELVNGKRGIPPEMAVRLARLSVAPRTGGLCNRPAMTLRSFAATA
jgi:Helix-turn-helix